MKYDAFLFDLDGTLTNTVHLYNEAFLDGLHAVKIPMTPEEWWRLRQLGQTPEMIMDKLGIAEEGRVIIEDVRRNVYAFLLASKGWMPGAPELLQMLSEHHRPSAIITHSNTSHVNFIDEILNIRKYIQDIITKDDLKKRMKPHPFGLRKAARVLKVDAKKCIYIGDQLMDMQAAKSAGMTGALVLGPDITDEAIEEAEIILESIGDARGLLEETD